MNDMTPYSLDDMPADGEDVREPIPPQQFVAMVTQSDNLAADLEEQQAKDIARQVCDEYKLDKDSMSDWLDRMEKGLELAKLSKGEMKSYPFKNAADIKFPLVTSAALQFNARAYPAIVQADRPVKVKTHGNDPSGKKAARGERVSEHMSWQLLSKIEEWEEDTDKLLTILPIVGTMVRKTWYDPAQERPRSRLIEAGRFIVNDKVRNLTDAPRASEEIDLYPSEVRERINSKQFVEVELEYDDEDKSAPCLFIEQHCRLDLDEDGYPEPYIATIYEKNQQLVRLVADFTEEDVKFAMGESVQMVPVPMMGPQGPMMAGQMPQRVQVPTGIRSIRRNSYFTAYHFLPSLDGGFFGTGLGLLLGDISKSINSIINMLLDAGHYASLGGGFIGSDFRVKGGKTRFEPGEWKQVTAKGGDVRNSLVPMTFPGPDAVLFNMLSLLIDAGREIASVKDIMTGEQPRQNETATGTLARIEQGMMVFTAAYKRVFRGLKREFKILARINAETVTPEEYNAFHDPEPEQGPDGQPMPPQMFDPRADYGAADLDIEPVADPASVTKMQQMAKAQLVMDMAERGMADRGEAAMRIGEAASIPDMEELAPKPDPMAPMMQELQVTMMVTELKLKQADVMKREAEVQKLQVDAMATMEGVELDKAKFQLDAFAKGLAEERERLGQAMDGAMKQLQAMKAA